MRRLLLEKRRERHINAQEVLAAVSFLEVEERTGRMDLDTGEFRFILQRFSELAKLDHEQVWRHDIFHICSWAMNRLLTMACQRQNTAGAT